MGGVNHTWDLCSMCGVMVRCGTCGNNCCNAMYGELADGTDCPDCESAYAMQDAGLKDGTAPKPESFGARGTTQEILAWLGAEPVEFSDIENLLEPDGTYTTPENP